MDTKPDPQTLEIEELAWAYWEAEGRPEGRALDHWVRAEAELRARDTALPRKRREPKASMPLVGRSRSVSRLPS